MIVLNLFLIFWLLRTSIFSSCNESANDHFGGSGPFETVDEVEGFLESVEFFKEYVERNKPLKMLSAANKSPAFELWADDYFLSRKDLEGVYVTVEKVKLEDRNSLFQNFTFLDFLHIYNDSNNYLVSELPLPLRMDIYLPSPLQCPHIYKNLLLENLMWMSSGDTDSVVHTDSAENIICMFRGSKRFVLIDPNKYSEQVPMEHPDEGYSDINVTQVDYSKYRGLLDVKYHQVFLSKGDCFYVPFEWIHQVTSRDSNIAVNVWWKRQQAPIDLSPCHHEPHATIADADFKGVHLRSELVQLLGEGAGALSFKAFSVALLEERGGLGGLSKDAANYLKKMFMLCDTNHDTTVTTQEVEALSYKEWKKVELAYLKFDSEVAKSSSFEVPNDRKDEL